VTLNRSNRRHVGQPKQNITRTPGTPDDHHVHIKPARVYIKLNITNPPVRRHHALPHNLVTRTNYTSWAFTRTNYTSWGDDPSHLPSKTSSPNKTHLDPSVYKFKTLRASIASQHHLLGSPRRLHSSRHHLHGATRESDPRHQRGRRLHTCVARLSLFTTRELT
jgi:hypothetical protein